MSRPDDAVQVAVVGAGAAGLLAAIFAARAGARTALLETRSKPGAKIRVSGGGRCNVLPSRVELDDFHTSGSPRTMRNILFSWPLPEVREFFERDLDIPLKVEPNGKVFPRSDDAREVVRALLAACDRAGVELLAPFRVAAVRRPDGEHATFAIASDDERTVRAERVVLATGGLSLPKTGSDGGGWRIARDLGHTVSTTYPALVPLLSSDPRWTELAGVSCHVRLVSRCEGRVMGVHEGNLLFTHRGFSGPVVLDTSRHLTGPGGADRDVAAHWGGGAVDWDTALRRGGRGTVLGVLRENLPKRLALLLLQLADVPVHARLSELPRDPRRRLAAILCACPLPVSGDEGYRAAEVTGGGIPLAEVRTPTLESRRVPGLYFCGETLDVTGRIGGFNFLWAWVTGRKVGRAVSKAALA